MDNNETLQQDALDIVKGSDELNRMRNVIHRFATIVAAQMLLPVQFDTTYAGVSWESRTLSREGLNTRLIMARIVGISGCAYSTAKPEIKEEYIERIYDSLGGLLAGAKKTDDTIMTRLSPLLFAGQRVRK